MRHLISKYILYFRCTTGLNYVLILNDFCYCITIEYVLFMRCIFFQLSWSHSLQDLRFLLFHVISLGLKSQDRIRRLNSLLAHGLKLNSQYLTRFAFTSPAYNVDGVPYWYNQRTNKIWNRSTWMARTQHQFTSS